MVVRQTGQQAAMVRSSLGFVIRCVRFDSCSTNDILEEVKFLWVLIAMRYTVKGDAAMRPVKGETKRLLLRFTFHISRFTAS